MYKKIHEIDAEKLMRVITTAYDTSIFITNAAQLQNHTLAFSDEISKVAEGCSQEDAAKIHHKAFETLEQFKKQPALRELFE